MVLNVELWLCQMKPEKNQGWIAEDTTDQNSDAASFKNCPS
jgi:hypothetical protein